MRNKPENLEQPQLLESAQVWDESTHQWITAYRKGWKRQRTVILIDGVTFNASTTTKTSTCFECRAYTSFLLLHNLDVTGTPTDILVELEFSDDLINWYKYMQGPFGDLRWEDGAGDKLECVNGPVLAPYVRIKVTATGTDGDNTFKSTVKLILNS